MKASFYEEELPPDSIELSEQEIEEAGDKENLSVIVEEAPEVDDQPQTKRQDRTSPRQ